MSNSTEREKEIFEEALAITSAEARSAYLKGACGRDEALRKQMDDLLKAYVAADGFIPTKDEAETIFGAALAEGPGAAIGRYRLLQKIGEGGCGIVYMAEQEEPVRRRVAVKIIKLGMDTRQVVARFEAERQALAMMDHPNIARVLDAGATQSGRPYFVMELVRGIKITEYCDKGHLSTQSRLELFMQVCNAIQHAHQKGIIHRDIKPSNILVTLHDGVPVPKVIDFGIAKATEGRLTDKTLFTAFEQFIGTPAYMSPEQAEMSGLDIDTRSDIYSLGVLLYELLTGETPFDAKELMDRGLDEVRRTIRDVEPPRPSTRLSTLPDADQTTVAKARSTEMPKLIHAIRGDLDWIVMKALEKDRTRRYETANGFAMDIKRFLNTEAVLARPPSGLYRFQKLVRRNKLVCAAAGTGAAALIVGLAVSTWLFFKERSAREFVEDQRKVILQARVDNQESRDKAESSRRLAEEQKSKAEQSELEMRRVLYASDMNLAQQALAVNNLGRAIQLLERHRPTNSAFSTDNSQPSTDLRGWEWRYLWQQCQSDALFILCQKPNAVWSLAGSPDEKSIAIGEKGFVSIWDWRTRQEITRLPTGTNTRRLAFSPRGDLLAYDTRLGGTETNSRVGVQVWDVANKKVVAEIPREGWCQGLGFSHDGKELIVCTGELDGRITLWRISDGQKAASYPAPQVMAPGNAFLADPSQAAAVHGTLNGRIRVLDLISGKERWTAKAADEFVNALALSPNGKILASGAGFAESAIRLWDFSSGIEILRLETGGGFTVGLAFSADGKTLVSAGSDQTIRLWDLRDLADVPPPLPLRGHRAEPGCLALIPNSGTLVSADNDGVVYLWDATRRRRERSHIVLPPTISTWAFGADSQSVLTLDREGGVARWHGIDFEQTDSLLRIGTNTLTARFSDDAQLLVSSSPHARIQTWNLGQRSRQWEFSGRDGELDFDFVHVGKNLVTANSHDGSFHEFDTATGQRIRSWQSAAGMWEPVFSSDARSCFTFDHEGVGLLRDLSTGTETSLNPGMRMTTGASFSPDGKLFAVTSHLPCAWLWETATRRQIATLRGFLQGVHSATFSPDGKRLVTSSDGREAIKLWSVESHHELLTLAAKASVFKTVAFSPDGNTIGAVGQESGLLYLWRAPSWREIEAAESSQAINNGAAKNSEL